MHIPDIPKIFFVSRSLTYCLAPFFDTFKNSMLYPRWSNRRSFGEPPYELVKEFFCANLEMEGVSAVLDAYIE